MDTGDTAYAHRSLADISSSPAASHTIVTRTSFGYTQTASVNQPMKIFRFVCGFIHKPRSHAETSLLPSKRSPLSSTLLTSVIHGFNWTDAKKVCCRNETHCYVQNDCVWYGGDKNIIKTTEKRESE